jgi:hypothetical protein
LSGRAEPLSIDQKVLTIFPVVLQSSLTLKSFAEVKCDRLGVHTFVSHVEVELATSKGDEPVFDYFQ